MTPRQQALLSYVGAIAFDRRVQRAIKTFDATALTEAVYACVREDVPAVGAIVLQNGKSMLERAAERAIHMTEPVMRDVVEDAAYSARVVAEGAINGIFSAVSDFVGGKKRR